jgi:RNA methyltransferase, TrmH family
MAGTPTHAIYSRQNSRVKELRAALQRSGRGGGLIGLEGSHLIEEAIDSGIEIETVFVEAGSEGLLAGLHLPQAVDILSLSPDVFASAVSTDTPQPLAALAKAPSFTLNEVFGSPGAMSPGNASLVIVTAGLQDPGNLGTLVRSAEAFGATGMVLLPGTTSLWNAKTLRASSGSAFRLPAVHCENEALLHATRERGVRLLATVPHNPGPSPSIDLCRPVAILIGNEGAGLSRVWIEAADERIMIPTPGRTESLNAAVAGSVLLYEAARQRGLMKEMGV